jgi:hypothetical protein
MKVVHDFFPATIVAVAPGIVEDFTTVTTNRADVPNGNMYFERVRVVVMQKDDGTNILMVAADHHTGPRLIFSERLSNLNWTPHNEARPNSPSVHVRSSLRYTYVVCLPRYARDSF